MDSGGGILLQFSAHTILESLREIDEKDFTAADFCKRPATQNHCITWEASLGDTAGNGFFSRFVEYVQTCFILVFTQRIANHGA